MTHSAAANIGKQLSRLRKSRGISQMKLSKQCKLSLGCIASVEAGRRFPSFQTLIRLCEVLGAKFSLVVQKKESSK